MQNLLLNNANILVIATGIIGLLVGSFLNVVIYRLPIMLKRQFAEECQNYLEETAPKKFKFFNLLTPRSHCPQCESLIPIWCNIPVISFLMQKGKCLDCGLAISWRYPAVELLTCFASICVAHKFGFSIQTIAALFLTWSLIAATFIDFEHQLIPDSISVPLIWLGLLLNTWQLFTTPEKAIIGASSAYLTLWLVAYIYRLIRKTDGMGNGDFKLFAVFGAWFGWEYLPFILLLASITGTLVAIVLLLKKQATLKSAIAFGPYLAIAGWIIMFWGNGVRSCIEHFLE